MRYDATSLVVHPGNSTDPQVVVEVTPQAAGWEFIHFQVRKLATGQNWSWNTGQNELAIVTLSGTLDITSNRGAWQRVGARKNVFAGPPHTLYLPRATEFSVAAQDDAEFAVTWVPTDQDHSPRLVTPEQVTLEIRGGDNATRHINNMIAPGFDCHRLVVVEVYTPSGSWSSYPPHKHDVHKEDERGTLLEADLEEVYYYKIDKPEGFAIQRVYTDAESPLHAGGHPIDAALIVHNNDVVLVPEGYHPVTSPPGYTTYYLNVLAGSAQALTATEDPAHAWVRSSYTSKDPRVPIY